MSAWIGLVQNTGPFNTRTIVGTTGIMHETLLYLTRSMGQCNIRLVTPLAFPRLLPAITQVLTLHGSFSWTEHMPIAAATSFPLPACVLFQLHMQK